MEGSAPASARISRTFLLRPDGSFTNVLSFPSEKVPAPPSPNWTFDSGLSSPPRQKASTFCVLESTSSPRSRIRGEKPALASIRPQNMPAGPNPTITGLWQSGSCPCSGNRYGFSVFSTTFTFFAFLITAPSFPETVAFREYM